uniref:Nucleoid-associated protein n=1 Tax=Corethron hystrix TaxID=216773 RepID=A0A7S1BEQ4_9STRA|mmetsp:Transcript_25059/g.57908  ORF Transcript_25059/g.57908 Transcript_25059/m.57908 type:complete len:160 (+) Transcript_25059:247-726(+)|eukprot:CAMPEP_0113299102 /NCGR_PEP_ID=MMETSP0010_2-20120614/1274_1 /TAXON_ID=216773 ORGANISM="Corethron hystrix, Strain 308" /NCGR_SAMPLE_ID=MMETSP0010_2 /ASSEMBLY_ACC=CAM_ASM_000155 /LENGTH=159 /DNA_ID=CAMNT_0000152275 /DNA_START=108 /DNA_END=587 /DNA_ORIENTATION=+ /assembly_acc=CAM_ASM_000155
MKIYAITALLATLSPMVMGFAPVPFCRSATFKSSTSLNLFGGKKDGEKGGGGGMGDMMENFKKAQEIGKKTQALQAELAECSIDGTGADGKVTVTINGQQKPKSVDIDEGYLGSAGAEELSTELTKAFQDAHTKSMALMTEKMQALYGELGLAGMAPPQ